MLKAPKVPCGSCPYRRDVPSGIWAAHEYDKLPEYDGPTPRQSPNLFMCHQQDGHLCGGWLACHDPNELLAIRFQTRLPGGEVDPSVLDYKTDVPVFASGAEARAHGLKDLECPQAKARRMMKGLVRKREQV